MGLNTRSPGSHPRLQVAPNCCTTGAAPSALFKRMGKTEEEGPGKKEGEKIYEKMKEKRNRLRKSRKQEAGSLSSFPNQEEVKC